MDLFVVLFFEYFKHRKELLLNWVLVEVPERFVEDFFEVRHQVLVIGLEALQCFPVAVGCLVQFPLEFLEFIQLFLSVKYVEQFVVTSDLKLLQHEDTDEEETLRKGITTFHVEIVGRDIYENEQIPPISEITVHFFDSFFLFSSHFLVLEVSFGISTAYLLLLRLFP